MLVVEFLVLRFGSLVAGLCGEGRLVHTFYFIQGYLTPLSQGLACPVTQLSSHQALVKQAPTGNRLLYGAYGALYEVFFW